MLGYKSLLQTAMLSMFLASVDMILNHQNNILMHLMVDVFYLKIHLLPCINLARNDLFLFVLQSAFISLVIYSSLECSTSRLNLRFICLPSGAAVS